MKARLKRLYQRLFVRRALFPLHRWMHRAALAGMGVLNYEDFRVSGEAHFLEREVGRRKQGPITVLDVGAHHGAFAREVMRVFPQARLYAFEPNPRAFAALEAAAAAVGFTAVPVACGAAPGTLEFFDVAGEGGSSHASTYREVIEDLHGERAVAQRVPVTTLDAFCAREGLARVDLLKVDTEGHELAVLEGAKGLLEAGAVDIIHFEFNEMNTVSRVFLRDFRQLLEDFELFRLLPDGMVSLEGAPPEEQELFAFQNLAAFRRQP